MEMMLRREQINEAGPLAVQAIKKSVLAGRDLLHTPALEKEMQLGIPVSMSEDCREGTGAYRTFATQTINRSYTRCDTRRIPG
jgi:hypothetical protein